MKLASRLTALLLASLLPTLPVLAQTQDYALPERVARLSHVQGDVSFAAGGGDQWSVAQLNRPLLAGDRLYTGEDSRAVLEMDGSSLRVDFRTAVDLVALNDERTQVQVTQGTVNLGVQYIASGQTLEVDTPVLAFVADRPGSYRIDIDPDGHGAMVTVLSGQGQVWGSDNTSRTVLEGRSYRFDGSDMNQVRISSIPTANTFDRFCADLDARYTDSVSSRYVAETVIGYSDLDHYGTWQTSADYGQIWFPSTVSSGWAPYRDGRWTWIEPWGWTWVDNAPWGFAPFHYGRWAYVHNRWGWVPGPRTHRAVFAPALVAFVGNVSISIGGGAPVGWFPLGPRDYYQPPYRVTENYFININLGGSRFFQRNQVRARWTDYHAHRPHQDFNYAYRNNPRAVTVVSRDDFRNSRLVQRSAARVDEVMLRNSQIERAPALKPAAPALRTAAARVQPDQQVLARPVVSHSPAGLQSATQSSGRVGVMQASPRGAPQTATVVARPPATAQQSGPQRAPATAPERIERASTPTARHTPAPTAGSALAGSLPRVAPVTTTSTTTPRAPATVPVQQPVNRAPTPRALPATPRQTPATPSAPRVSATPVIRSAPASLPRSAPVTAPRVTQPTRSIAPTPTIQRTTTPTTASRSTTPAPARPAAPTPGRTVAPVKTTGSSTTQSRPASTPTTSKTAPQSSGSAAPRGQPVRRTAAGNR